MPSILVQIDTEVDVEVEVNEFLDDCNTSEIEEVIDWLKENRHIKDTHSDRQVCAAELEFIEALDKLYTKWNALSKEEESFIINISKRF
jgi:F0F1-type ATP synthase epsilon subunit